MPFPPAYNLRLCQFSIIGYITLDRFTLSFADAARERRATLFLRHCLHHKRLPRYYLLDGAFRRCHFYIRLPARCCYASKRHISGARPRFLSRCPAFTPWHSGMPPICLLRLYSHMALRVITKARCASCGSPCPRMPRYPHTTRACPPRFAASRAQILRYRRAS